MWYFLFPMKTYTHMRIHAIPFNRTFTAEQQDKDLGIKLTAELPGILNWAIKGCLDWQE